MKKKIIFIITIFFIFSGIFYFVVTGPLFFNKIDEKLLINIDIKEENLKEYVKFLSENDRTSLKGQEEIVNYIIQNLKNNGIEEKDIKIQKYIIDKNEYNNIIVSFEKPSFQEKIIIGAHYDAFDTLPGADDNASSIAGLLEISRILKKMNNIGQNIELVFFSTEEPPFFASKNMGSYIHANRG